MAELALWRNVEFIGELSVFDRLVDPLRRALDSRPGFYHVRLEPLGDAGEVRVSISGVRGQFPLILSPQDLEADDVFRIVSDTMDRFDL